MSVLLDDRICGLVQVLVDTDVKAWKDDASTAANREACDGPAEALTLR